MINFLEEYELQLIEEEELGNCVIATAEQPRKTTENFQPNSMNQSTAKGESKENKGQETPSSNSRVYN